MAISRRKETLIESRSHLSEPFTKQTIDDAYKALGYTKGWNFLSCREERLSDASVAIVGLNPGKGGDGDSYDYTGIWSCGNNSFCEDESSLRDQVREWHRILGLGWEDTLCAQFVPFRSPDLQRLQNRHEAFEFARPLWTWVLRISPASCFLAMGNAVAWQLADLMEAQPVTDLPTNWGKTTVSV